MTLGNPYITDLLAIEDAIFVVDILNKTRDGGLPWKKMAPDLFTITLCEEPDCIVPYQPTEKWTLYVGRNRANDGAMSYVYYLDVTIDKEYYFSTDSRQTNYVESLFREIEVNFIPPCDIRINRALDFITTIPTSPRSDVVTFTMCGSATVGGSVLENFTQTIILIPSGTVAGGYANVSQYFYETANYTNPASDGILFNGISAIEVFNASIAPPELKTSGTADSSLIKAASSQISIANTLIATAV